MRMTSTGAFPRALAAARPPKPPPTITTRGVFDVCPSPPLIELRLASFIHSFLKLLRPKISENLFFLQTAIVSSGANRRPAEAVILCQSLAFSDRFFHHLPRSCRQWSHPIPGEVPQAFVYVATVKKHDAFTRVRVVKRRARIFRDQSKQSLSPGIVGRMENLVS